jgi:hypothetical protein
MGGDSRDGDRVSGLNCSEGNKVRSGSGLIVSFNGSPGYGAYLASPECLLIQNPA